MTATVIPLIDGALYCDPRIRRQQVVDQMAAELVRWEAHHNEDDAFRALVFSSKYKILDVALLFRDATYVAAQTIVAQEMGDRP